MFGLGAPEIIGILIVALLLFGPRKLPELARSLGRSIVEFKRASSEITSEITSSIMDEDKPGGKPEDKPKS